MNELIPSRLDELRSLKDGWLDGKGIAPPASGLDWFALAFETNYPTELPLPYLYPTAEGGIQAEWSFSENELSLEVDLATRRGHFHQLNLATEIDESRIIDLESREGWKWLGDRLRERAGGHE